MVSNNEAEFDRRVHVFTLFGIKIKKPVNYSDNGIPLKIMYKRHILGITKYIDK